MICRASPVEVGLVHVARVLLALLAVEELGVLPEPVLLAGGEPCHLLGVEHALTRAVARRRAERLVDDLDLALADLVRDQLGEAALQRERLADRALVVAVSRSSSPAPWRSRASAPDCGMPASSPLTAVRGGAGLGARLEAALLAAAADDDQDGDEDDRPEDDRRRPCAGGGRGGHVPARARSSARRRARASSFCLVREAILKSGAREARSTVRIASEPLCPSPSGQVFTSSSNRSGGCACSRSSPTRRPAAQRRALGRGSSPAFCM